jgi:hypothetical protein
LQVQKQTIDRQLKRVEQMIAEAERFVYKWEMNSNETACATTQAQT